MAYKVKRVISYDTVQVYPEWRIWSLKKGGDLVKLNGCQLKNGGKSAMNSAKVRLTDLLEGKVIDIKNVYKVQGKTVTADAFVGDKHLSEFLSGVVGLNAASSAPKDETLPPAEEEIIEEANEEVSNEEEETKED